ncbi:MAG TPA: class D sortase [Thermoanaerobaculia bacterium]|nr:class D sortase [Thermoanaerobaculia bacterium]
MTRRQLSTLLVLAGIVVLAVVGYEYFRGYRGQEEGREAWDKARAAAPVPTLHVPPPAAQATPSGEESPGIEAPAPTPAPAEPPYPQGQPIARIKIPRVKMDYVVFGGVDPATLNKGPGHVPGSELPGEHTNRNNCVITAHRDKHFRRLSQVKDGEKVELETPNGTLEYRIVSHEIVMPDAVRVLAPTEKPRLTLITCYPFNWVGAAPKRIVFVAEPVEPKSASQASADRHPS